MAGKKQEAERTTIVTLSTSLWNRTHANHDKPKTQTL